jgi:SAM-dependent methyltransferase
MYSSLFCRLYNEFGWNEYPRAFAEELLTWLDARHIHIRTALDIGCGTGVLCEALSDHGIETLGIDLSAEMIAIAQERAPLLSYRVADMVTFSTSDRFDLVTCTGDALNHITDAHELRKVVSNVWDALNPGGLFVFDLLNAGEVPDGDPFEADFDGGLTVRFRADHDFDGFTTLRIDGCNNGVHAFSEVIRERLYEVDEICDMLAEAGFKILQCSGSLLEGKQSTTWYIVTRKHNRRMN